MSQKLVFLGWDKPWTDLFAEWLGREPERLRRRLVVVPTRESGRQLREKLLHRTDSQTPSALLGPRMATPDDFFRPAEIMPDAVRWAGWLEVLRGTRDDEVAALFPAGVRDKEDSWRLAIAQQIEQARESLISGNVDFSEVARRLPEDNARWTELAQLERRAVAAWEQWGFPDPAAAKRDRARHPVCPQGVEEIILAGLTDPTWLAVEAWRLLAEQKIPITLLVGAPETFRPTFDDWGRPKPEFWADRRRHATPEPDTALVAADAVALADVVVQACAGRSNRDVAVGICDSSFAPAIARRFQEAGWRTFTPEGLALAKDGWPELLEALAGALAGPDDYAAIVRVARHPSVWRDWLRNYGAKACFAALGAWEAEHPAASLTAALVLLGASKQEAEKAAGELLATVRDFVQQASADRTAFLETQLLAWFQTAPSQVSSHALTEMASWPRLQEAGFDLPLRLNWLAASIAQVSRSPDTADAVLALQGWLELPFDPAAHLILAGLHEGRVPEAPAADPLVTEAVREQFGLRDRRTRLAREIFLYTALVEGRRTGGSVTVFTALTDAQGEPCRPSRVLLQARPEQLPERVLKFVKEEPDEPLRPIPPWSRDGWKLRPPAHAAANRDWEKISPSALRSYLTCPTRFYFERVLGWRDFKPFDGELDSRQFGILIHAVLNEWGSDPHARELSDAGDLRSHWLGSLKHQARERFGAALPPLIRLQLMAAEERLVALAEHQAEQRQLGWHILEVETELNGVLTLGGLPLQMRVDRIDRHDDGRMRVIDYKTGKTGISPLKAHLRPWPKEQKAEPLGPLAVIQGARGAEKSYGWADLQLPLYAAAVQKKYSLKTPPEAWYALLPEAVSDTQFAPFDQMEKNLDSTLEWGAEAARRIVAGIFWPPAPEVKYDTLAALAPEGLETALGKEWEIWLSGHPAGTGGRAA